MLDSTLLRCQKAYAYMLQHQSTAKKAAAVYGLSTMTFRLYRYKNNLTVLPRGRTPVIHPQAARDTAHLPFRKAAEYLSVSTQAVISARRWLNDPKHVIYKA